ncbi:hypothetical protein HRbin01_00921 [archaeon HR01]|nr:hypothetical protein HRbin01_00921 [archaeon HR01]
MPTVNSAEISILLDECRASTLDAIVRNVYQPTSKSVILKIYKQGNTAELWLVSGECFFITSLEVEKPPTPSTFAMELRKRLKGLKIQDIRQHNSERIIYVAFQENRELVTELMPPGNIILLKDGLVELALHTKASHDRALKLGKPYAHPKPRYSITPGGLDASILSRLNPRSPVISAVSRDLGLGGKFAEEILFRASVEKDKTVSELTEVERTSIYMALASLLSELSKPKPRIYHLEDGELLPSPVELKHLTHQYVETTSFSEAVAKSYLRELEIERKRSSLKPLIERLRSLDDEIADKMYSLETLTAREKSMEEAIRVLESLVGRLATPLRGDELRSAGLLVEERGRTLEVKIGENVVVLRTDESVWKQISEKYGELKKLREAIAKLSEDVEELKKKRERAAEELAIAESEVETPLPKVSVERRPVRKQLREFVTSDGFKVVSGRDSRSNIHVLRHLMEEGDIVMHTEIAGSPVTLVKGGVNAPSTSLEEAAQFTACYSRAWREGFSVASVYYVNQSQISLSAPSGQYLPKGSFMVIGRRTYLESHLSLAVCRVGEEELDVLPELTARRKSLRHVVIRPGKTPAQIAAEKILEYLSIGRMTELVEWLKTQIPYGRCSIYVGDKLINS